MEQPEECGKGLAAKWERAGESKENQRLERKAGSERRQRKTEASAEHGDSRGPARPRGSGPATGQVKPCPKAWLNGANTQTRAAPAAGNGKAATTGKDDKKGSTAQPRIFFNSRLNT